MDLWSLRPPEQRETEIRIQMCLVNLCSYLSALQLKACTRKKKILAYRELSRKTDKITIHLINYVNFMCAWGREVNFTGSLQATPKRC